MSNQEDVSLPPDPLTPADCDLRGLQYMPLFGDRLLGSATWIAASPEGKVASLRLWWRAYAHEVPAGSLPDDDNLLADYAGYGIGVKAWRKIKDQAMRGWVKCSDGRLYHKVVCEIALESWASRLRNRKKQERWREKSRNRDDEVTQPVTVTETVTQPFRNAGDGQGREGKEIERESGARASALPADWQPSDPDLAWAGMARPDLQPADIQRETEAFRNHALGNGRLGREWGPLWRNWIGKSKIGGTNGQQHHRRQGSHSDDHDAFAAGVRKALAGRSVPSG